MPRIKDPDQDEIAVPAVNLGEAISFVENVNNASALIFRPKVDLRTGEYTIIFTLKDLNKYPKWQKKRFTFKLIKDPACMPDKIENN